MFSCSLQLLKISYIDSVKLWVSRNGCFWCKIANGPSFLSPEFTKATSKLEKQEFHGIVKKLQRFLHFFFSIKGGLGCDTLFTLCESTILVLIEVAPACSVISSHKQSETVKFVARHTRSRLVEIYLFRVMNIGFAQVPS